MAIIKTKRFYHDEHCPRCQYPETILVEAEATHTPLYFMCGNRCGWDQQIIDTGALPKIRKETA